ncbi:GGDEF domain-containing protein [Paenibacillus sp. 2TAB23]|uniref:GGDEF domain-containing protein n=1 Tax=Paenibacillus sp. 2TAB23 TaxID=3233004 RepID=UPI003F9CC887
MNQKSDHTLEIIFSMLRWLFLIASGLIYGLYYYKGAENLTYFSVLFCLGVVYMATADIVIHRSIPQSRAYLLVSQAAVIIDIAAFTALISLTGGTSSPLLPIAYLIILHAAVYWRFAGGLLSSVALIAGYVLVMLLQPQAHTAGLLPFHIMNISFLAMAGILGGVIVARERRHLTEKSYFENQSKRDYLTGLYNHRSFQEQLAEQIGFKRSFTLVMADIDYFKGVNDRYGHVTGDVVLKRIAQLLEGAVSRRQGAVFRYGGEEFAILLYAHTEAEVTRILERVRLELSMLTFEAGEQVFHVTMSFGAVTRTPEWTDDIVNEADTMLYSAKKQGRNCIVWGA